MISVYQAIIIWCHSIWVTGLLRGRLFKASPPRPLKLKWDELFLEIFSWLFNFVWFPTFALLFHPWSLHYIAWTFKIHWERWLAVFCVMFFSADCRDFENSVARSCGRHARISLTCVTDGFGCGIWVRIRQPFSWLRLLKLLSADKIAYGYLECQKGFE